MYMIFKYKITSSELKQETPDLLKNPLMENFCVLCIVVLTISNLKFLLPVVVKNIGKRGHNILKKITIYN